MNPKLRLPGVAPRRKGELGGKPLSKSSGLSCPPKDTRFLLGTGSGRSSHLCFLLEACLLPAEHQAKSYVCKGLCGIIDLSAS